MTFDELWPTLAIPGEYDAMDSLDQARWRGVIRQAFEAGQAGRDEAVFKAENREAMLEIVRADMREMHGNLQKMTAERDALKGTLGRIATMAERAVGCSSSEMDEYLSEISAIAALAAKEK